MLSRLAAVGVAHPRRVALLAALAFVVAGMLGGPAPGKLAATRAFDDPGSQSTHARQEIEAATGRGANADVVALVKARGAVDRTAATLRADPAVAAVAPPVASRDGSEALLPVTLRAGVKPNDVVDRLQSTFKGDHDVVLGGNAVAQRQVGKQATKDLARSELIAFPLLALLSLLVFRGVAALLPVAIGALSVLGAFAALRGINAGLSLSPFALNLVIGLGLGLAVDYSLFCVSRFREELGKGVEVGEAVRTTVLTAGRTVLFSAATVAAACVCLTLFPQRFLVSMGLGGIVVALVAAAATVLVLPALLALMGRRLGKVVPAPERSGRWYRLARAVMRRPGLTAVATAAALLALAAPATGIHWSGIDATLLPKSQTARVVSDTIARDFPRADASPVIVAVRGSPTQARAFDARLRALPEARRVGPARELRPDLWQIDVQAKSSPIGAPAIALVRAIRAAPAGFPVLVGGASADLVDQRAAVSHTLPAALILLVALTVAVLWLMTGSVVLPVKALLMNVLTTAAAAGVLVVGFQHGSTHGIEQTDFLVLVAIVFGLSTDYGVFLLTRIKEARDRGLPDAEAVAVGLQRTGAIVSAAALLLAVALGAFVTSKLIFLRELGVGAAAAVLLDAFAVRALLVPSLMRLLGGANWWSPRPLRRLHAKLAPEPA
jgi:uncharacterized membrane protein YdfJ with MMPL/SSD domain